MTPGGRNMISVMANWATAASGEASSRANKEAHHPRKCLGNNIGFEGWGGEATLARGYGLMTWGGGGRGGDRGVEAMRI